MKHKLKTWMEKNEYKKVKAVRWFAGFLIFMLVCTLVSRGIYAYQLPQVKTGYAVRQSISHRVQASGSFVAKEETAVITLPDIHVKTLYVTKGQQVTEDTVLFLLDTEEIEAKLSSLKAEQTLAKQQKNELSAKKDKQTQLDEMAKERAEEDLTDSGTMQQEVLAKAQESYDIAVKELEDLVDFDTYLSQEKNKSIEYLTLKGAIEKEDAAQEDKDAWTVFLTVYEKQKKEEWEQKKEALEENLRLAAWNLKMTELSCEESLKAAGRAAEDADLAETVTIKSDEMQLENTIARLGKEMLACQQLLDQEGKVMSNCAGMVKEIKVAVGEKTSEDTAVLLSNHESGYYFQAEITEEQAGYLEAGDLVTISAQGGKIKLEQIPITSVLKDAERYLVTADVENQQISENDMAELDYTKAAEPSACCVPLSALYGSGLDTYILLLQEQETILGTEYRVEKRVVTVTDKNEKYAALLDAPLSDMDQVIIQSDRMVQPGDTVRLMEDYE